MAEGWMEQGTALFTDRLARADLDAPTLLPGWSGRHLAAHVAGNARALARLAQWARTGEEQRMYAGPEARDAEIERDSLLTHSALRDLVDESAAELDAALGRLSDLQWHAKVITAQGREVPATEITWIRSREVWVHAADLGASFEEFPAELVDALLTEVTRLWRRRGQGPALLLAPDDRDRTWNTGEQPVKATGTAAELAAWITGRGDAPDPSLPALGRWI